MLHYILQIVIFQLVFLVVYDVFLKRETFFTYNRFYLLTTSILSFVLPFVKLDLFKALQPDNFIVVLPEVVIGNITPVSELDQQIALQTGIELNNPGIPIWQIVLGFGVMTALLLFTYKLLKLYWLRHKNPKRWKGNVLIVNLMRSNAAFSFFNTVFLGEKISINEKSTILNHELVHVKQWHSIDLLVFEIMRIVLWFNPLVYMYQSRIKALHEYIADASAIEQNGKRQYYVQLLNQVFDTQQLSFTNTFFKSSLIKKRIDMLQKSKSKQIALIKYLLLFPAVFSMLLYVSCEKGVSEFESEQALDLEQYSYSMSLSRNMDDETKKIHEKYEDFLFNNSNYVSWAVINHETKEIRYSIHHKDEELSGEFTEAEVGNKDGETYKMYINFKNPFDFFASKGKSVTETEKLDPRDFDGKTEVPYAVIDKAPTFEECSQLTDEEEKKKCTSQKVAKFVNKNFNIEKASNLGLVGKQRISVFFKIDKDGNVIDIKARAPHPGLEEESVRVIELLPQMIPGEHNGEKVIVPYSLPIMFQIQPEN
ncbi:MAG: blaR1 peptidase M56 family protein [Winogradskyella sp.]|uniref:M56 family metallopeptidase n=1 Tax=Winogradskyella sp. TaxID=1883156 RepID=UPI000F41DC5E|nr:M56 family metallopeptidase [Winogradskyella sp.]RNC87728.1 MAG: blaR1 peptidase M56 family protein [Winogradskyella sp.]